MINMQPKEMEWPLEWKTDTFFGLKLSCLLFSASEQLSINLQAKNITVQEAVRKAIGIQFKIT